MTRAFDLQAHRGGAGLTAENTLAAFGAALDLGVSTLELDVHLTADDEVVVAHDRVVGADPRFLRQIGLEELSLLDVSDVRSADFPARPRRTGLRIPLLREVYALLEERAADPVSVNVEIKYDVAAPLEGADREHFVDVVVGEVERCGAVARTSIQAFDWAVLARVHEVCPALRRNVLASNKYLQPGVPGPSPWLGGIDVDHYLGGFAEAAAERGFDAISPIHGSPYLSGVTDPAYRAFADERLVAAAHDVGLLVVPYVVDDEPTMRWLIDIGADGLITNYLDRLRRVMAVAGLALPQPFPG